MKSLEEILWLSVRHRRILLAVSVCLLTLMEAYTDSLLHRILQTAAVATFALTMARHVRTESGFWAKAGQWLMGFCDAAVCVAEGIVIGQILHELQHQIL